MHGCTAEAETPRDLPEMDVSQGSIPHSAISVICNSLGEKDMPLIFTPSKGPPAQIVSNVADLNERMQRVVLSLGINGPLIRGPGASRKESRVAPCDPSGYCVVFSLKCVCVCVSFRVCACVFVRFCLVSHPRKSMLCS